MIWLLAGFALTVIILLVSIVLWLIFSTSHIGVSILAACLVLYFAVRMLAWLFGKPFWEKRSVWPRRARIPTLLFAKKFRPHYALRYLGDPTLSQGSLSPESILESIGTQHSRSIPYLLEAFMSASQPGKGSIAVALGRIGDSAVLEKLLSFAENSHNQEIAAVDAIDMMVARGLRVDGINDRLATLANRLEASSFQFAVAGTLARLKDSRAFPILVSRLKPHYYNDWAVNALVSLGDPRAVPYISTFLTNYRPGGPDDDHDYAQRERRLAAEALGALGAIEPLLEALLSPFQDARIGLERISPEWRKLPATKAFLVNTLMTMPSDDPRGYQVWRFIGIDQLREIASSHAEESVRTAAWSVLTSLQ